MDIWNGIAWGMSFVAGVLIGIMLGASSNRPATIRLVINRLRDFEHANFNLMQAILMLEAAADISSGKDRSTQGLKDSLPVELRDKADPRK
jgi:hypothetical protein